MTATTPLPLRICACCNQPIKGLARRLPSNHEALVGLGHDDCYGTFISQAWSHRPPYSSVWTAR